MSKSSAGLSGVDHVPRASQTPKRSTAGTCCWGLLEECIQAALEILAIDHVFIGGVWNDADSFGPGRRGVVMDVDMAASLVDEGIVPKLVVRDVALALRFSHGGGVAARTWSTEDRETRCAGKPRRGRSQFSAAHVSPDAKLARQDPPTTVPRRAVNVFLRRHQSTAI